LSSHIDPLRYKISWVGSEHPTPRSEIAAAGSPSGIELSATSSKLGTVYSTILPKSLRFILRSFRVSWIWSIRCLSLPQANGPDSGQVLWECQCLKIYDLNEISWNYNEGGKEGESAHQTVLNNSECSK